MKKQNASTRFKTQLNHTLAGREPLSGANKRQVGVAEGATAPEPLRPKDRRETHTLERMCLHITDGESEFFAKLSGSQTAGAVQRF
jgi:hypothetical protein